MPEPEPEHDSYEPVVPVTPVPGPDARDGDPIDVTGVPGPSATCHSIASADTEPAADLLDSSGDLPDFTILDDVELTGCHCYGVTLLEVMVI